MLPSADSATHVPRRPTATAPVPTSFLPCCVQTVPLRVNTHAPSAPHPPMMAVLPSAESATDIPWPSGNAGSPALLPTSLLPCCVQTSPLRVTSSLGHDTRALQHYLGHKNIQHTVRYTDMAPDRFKDFWSNCRSPCACIGRR